MEDNEDVLCEAARKGDVEKVNSLIEAGTDVTYFDADGLTPLMHAAKNGHTAVIKSLLEAGAPWNALDPSDKSAGDHALEANHQDAFDALLDVGLHSELILGAIARRSKDSSSRDREYLEDRVRFCEDKLMDGNSKAVMMGWELPLMEAHAKAICSGGSGHILNIGFGMGLVDTAIQKYSPLSHTIVEAHPEVYRRMLETGWDKKKNVKIIFGRWQDVLLELGTYDGIFFDTYGEYYEEMREFHQNLPVLLNPGGIYSFFNGFCGGNAFFHIIYCTLVSLELENLGYSVQLVPLPVKDCLATDVWEGVQQKYWQLDTYHLPVCQAKEDSK